MVKVLSRNLVLLVIIIVWPLMGVLAQDGQPIDIPLTPAEELLAEIYRTVSPSVVSIRIDERFGGGFQEVSGGTGFVIDTQGRIVTNFHVVDQADRIVVRFFDGTIVLGEVIGLDADADIAVIEVDVPQERLVPVRFADSERLVVGQSALAIGSPFGQNWTLTAGIVSALNREIEGLGGYRTGAVIQTDTPINPGNSGGPLLNLRGEVIGVNAQIISEERANSGVGFAIPSNLVQRVAGELIEFGRVNYSYLGISGENVDIEQIQALDLPNDTRGVVVGQAYAGEAAAEAGIRANDVIIAINGEDIIDFADLIGYLASYTAPGDTVNMTVLRRGQTLDLEVELGARN
ncbi:MAG: trypsin-like peptidase domain-containing protein [Anaerolineae bacterium]